MEGTNCQVPTGWGREEGHRGPVLRHTGRAEASPYSGSTERGEEPFWDALPGACPQPAPTDLATGPGPRSRRVHLLPCSRHTDASMGTRAPGRWILKVQPKRGLVFSLSVSPGCESLTCGPNALQRTTDTCGPEGRQGPRLGPYIARERSPWL